MSDALAAPQPDCAPPKASNKGGYRRLLRNKGFRRLWYAQFVSGIGDWLVIGFLMPLVTKLSGGSSFAVAGILIAKIVPALILSSFTGVLVDRFDRRKVMITADLVRMVLALALVWTNSLWVIYAVVLLMETASLFFWPARNALIPYLVDENDITAANGLSYTTQQASMVVGLSAVAAILAGFEALVRWVLGAGLPIITRFVGVFAPALLGERAGVILDSFTFIFSATMVALIAVKAKPASATGPLDLSLLGKDVLDSFRFLRAHVELRSLLLVIGLAILGGGAIIPVGIVYIAEESGNLFGGIPLLAGIPALAALVGSRQTFVLVCLAIGMVLGALIVPQVERRLRLQLLFAGSVATFGVSMLGFASVQQYWIACIFTMFAGACIATLTVAGNSYVVRTTEDSIRGRVFTAQESVIRVSLLLSMIVMAPLGDVVAGIIRNVVARSGVPYDEVYLTGPRITLWVASAIVIAAAAYAFKTLDWRQAEQCELPAEEAAHV
ncbi:MAG: MFS transporter [Coriobacteriia bacterium]|nr:MFS transporter [Coriobacteriia bacterium]